jgi:predicted ATPase
LFRFQLAILIELTREHRFSQRLAEGLAIQGWALAAGGDAGQAIAAISKGLADYEATGVVLFSPYFLALLAEAHRWAGDAATGMSRLAAALERVKRTGVRWIEAELHRLRGELLLSTPEPDPLGAEACLQRALAVARGQEARLWELRAATSLARLWRDQGKCGEARNLLAPVYGWFTEGFDTTDLKEAKTLLNELA